MRYYLFEVTAMVARAARGDSDIYGQSPGQPT